MLIISSNWSPVTCLTTVFCFSAAVSFMVAEQFGEAIEMEAITRAAKYGRMTGKVYGLGSAVGFTVDFQALVTVWSAPSWTASSGLSRTT